jgi:hypothetical protein
MRLPYEKATTMINLITLTYDTLSMMIEADKLKQEIGYLPDDLQAKLAGAGFVTVIEVHKELFERCYLKMNEKLSANELQAFDQSMMQTYTEQFTHLPETVIHQGKEFYCYPSSYRDEIFSELIKYRFKDYPEM